jgi:hypothetical protein
MKQIKEGNKNVVIFVWKHVIFFGLYVDGAYMHPSNAKTFSFSISTISNFIMKLSSKEEWLKEDGSNPFHFLFLLWLQFFNF